MLNKSFNISNARRRQLAESEVPGRAYRRTFELLAVLAEEPGALSASALARRLEIPKSTLSLMLQHFRAIGVVTPAAEGQLVGIGPELVKLGFRVLANFQIRRLARAHLERLAAETRKDIYLGIRYGLEVMYIDRVDGVDSVRLNVDLGTLRPMHSTALGKLVLALSPSDLLEAVVRHKGLPRVTSNTMTERARLERELALIRRQGYAVSDGENIEGIYAIAVPVTGPDGSLAGISLSTFRSQVYGQRDRLIAQMLDTAARINRIAADHASAATGHPVRREAGAPAPGTPDAKRPAGARRATGPAAR